MTLARELARGPGTDANDIVQLNGSGALPAVDGSLLTGVGAWTKIAATTISSPVATVDYTNLGAYASLRLTTNLIRPVTDNTALQMRLSSDNGATFLTSSYFTNAGTGSSSFTLSAAATTGVSNLTTDSGFSGSFQINNFNIAQKTTGNGWAIYFREGTNYISPTLMHNAQTAMNAIRIFFASGNIAVGNILLEGWTGS